MLLPAQEPHRILFYSHDSWGLGHLRRSLTIASRLIRTLPGSSAVVATGSSCATHFDVPPGVDLVKLPSIGKDARGRYTPRSLHAPLQRVVQLRRTLLDGIWRSYKPSLLIVDHQVTGLFDEMLGCLRSARRNGTRTVLGVRDVIDAPDRVAHEWGRESVRWALREGYDRVCVYGDPEVFDSRSAYPFPPELGERLEFVGYVVRPEASTGPPAMPELEPEVIVTTGGGEDGERRIEAYLDAVALAPAAWQSTIVLGPMLSVDAERRLRLRARGLQGVEWHRFVPDLPQRMARADAVVAMAGYNTVAELLAARRRSVLMPRTYPRREQSLRAHALERLGYADLDDGSDPRALRARVERTLALRSRDDLARVRLDGVDRMVEVARDLLEGEPSTSARLAPVGV